MNAPHRGPPHGVDIQVFDTIDSTSDEARRQAAAGHPGPLWIMAAEQTGGRGRRGRPWISVPGNLYTTVLLRPSISTSDAGRLSFVAAVALYRALAPWVPPAHSLRLKWPNDALINGAKVSGILLESQSTGGDHLDWVTIGIGINLANAPKNAETPAIALSELGVHVQPMEMFEALAHHMADLLAVFQARGFSPIRQAWLEQAAGIGQPIRVRLADRTLHGHFHSLDPDGALILDEAGTTTRIAAGEVFLNPAPASSGGSNDAARH
jgi:BirA family biotin operon repressor/biotin-[acetyl-CoA-carboxylase] ligase